MTAEPDPFTVLGLPVNASAVEIRAARRRLAKSLHPDVGGDAEAMQRLNRAAAAALAKRHDPRQASPPPTPGSRHVVDDRPSFTVEALPAETFEALLVVASWIGEVLVDDPPYVLDVHLTDPLRCWCRLELLPEAGASSVGLTLGAVEPGAQVPAVEVVRDLWVRCLNELDWSGLDGVTLERPPPW